MEYTNLMVQKHIRVSLVIPAYNEEHHLKACLDSVAAQEVKPYEVIVVDNASTDETASIARSYDFVKLITETRQGVVFARDTGFNAARGDVIGRIDSDTILPPTWNSQVQGLFMNGDIAAVSGKVHYHDLALRRVADAIEFFFRSHLARALARHNTVFLQGANLAVRRDAWERIRDKLCRVDGVHEDFDLAIHLQEHSLRVIFDEALEASISGRRADMGFLKAVHYILASPHTYATHHIRSRYYMYPVVAASIILYWPAHIIYRGYDETIDGFSFEKLLSPRALQPRLDPSTIFFK
jgi:glycosyltransferase involved in cell wall biosynthesis